MPSNIPSHLKLEHEPPVDEEDIGDLSPYLSLPSTTSSRASLATINSSSCSTSSPGFTTDDELDHSISSGTPRNQSFGFHLTPPSASYSLTTSVSRSHGLLPVQKDFSPRPLCKEIEALEVDPLCVAKIRRWILGIAVGEWVCFSPRLRLVTSCRSWVWLEWWTCPWRSLPTFNAPSGRGAEHVSQLVQILDF